ncbi:MAG: hypothetical protein Kapaf2KO_10130 [Candidatus Kapaibacteriales bacterium]
MSSTTVKDRVIDKLNGNVSLPAMPVTVSNLLRAIEDKDLGAKQISDIIEKDQSLTSRILKVANSPYYGFSRKVATIELATVVMGLNAIKEIAVSYVVKEILAKDLGRLSSKDFWNYSLFCATTCRLLSRKMGYPKAGEAYVAGLLHDIGVAITARVFPNEQEKIFSRLELGEESLLSIEKDILGLTHSEVGALVARKWMLPENVCNAIENHHSASPNDKFNSDEIEPLTAIVSLSEWFAIEAEQDNWKNSIIRDEYYLSGEILISSDEPDKRQKEFSKLRTEIENEYNRFSLTNI